MATVIAAGALVLCDGEQLYVTFGDASGARFGAGMAPVGCNMVLQIDVSWEDRPDIPPSIWAVQLEPDDARTVMLWQA